MGLSRKETAFLCAVLIYSFVPSFGGLARLAELAGAVALAPANPRALAMPLPILIHVLSSAVFCLAGALQFMPGFRQRHRAWHRQTGYAVAISGCLSAASGLWMTVAFTFPADLQGPLLLSARLVLGTAMIWLITSAVASARAGRFQAHAASMIRAYAIGQGASTQAFLGLSFLLLTGVEATGLVRDILMIAAWAANLAIAEFLIRRPLALIRGGAPA